ncbi:MAG: chromate transporter [Phycisphaerales bacterium]|nr:chromate transporter [Phycisphaerales bacterium]
MSQTIASESEGSQSASAHPSFGEALRFWLKLGFISFGGPTGQIAIMHTELVEKRRWISEARFLHALSYCMLLPGPEAQQLATYIGWLLHRTWGGIVAGSLFVLPSVFILWALSFVYVTYGNVPWIAAVFYGLKPAVTAIVAAAVIRISKRALKNEVMWTLAALAFVAIFFFKAPFPLIVLGAGVVGLVGARLAPQRFIVIRPHGEAGKASDAVISDSAITRMNSRPCSTR